MFLKRIEMQGFKSFADRTIITFDHPITGVVGPNGCGKSNIADAVRWVLGEQSAKSMRGQKMNDVIFAGSADRKKVNMAEVTLVFDNADKKLNSDLDEIEVTRRLFRNSGDAEYLINRRNVRLKDVVDLFLDTGLGRDSLSIISQGNVISFAEAKPQDRRGIFEEAAGVAKYKKRKLESLSKLERTSANLERTQDIVNELEKQVSPLKRAAHKAEIYRQKKKRLEEIEITVLVQDIRNLNGEIDSAKNTLLEIESSVTADSTRIQVTETQIQEFRKQVTQLDNEVTKLQDELMRNYNEVQQLESRKTELDERRKYIVETGSDEQRRNELKSLLDAARTEYEDRKERAEKLNRDIVLLSENLSIAAADMMEAGSSLDNAQMQLRNLENRRTVLEQMMRNPFNNQQGVRAVMDNRRALHGILGVTGQALKASSGYEEAVSTALGGAMNNIITDNEQSARDAIRFLDRNRSGRATFLPLTVCRPRYVSREHMVILEHTPGYLGTANQFVDCEERFNPVVSSLLGNVIVAEDLEAGNELSALTKRSYNIVTLNGEVIHRGGSMTGGRGKSNTNLITMQKEAQEIRVSLDSQSARVEIAKKKYREASDAREKISSQLQQKRFELAALEPVVDAKKAKYDKLRNDLALISDGEEESAETHEDELVLKLNKAYSRRDEINGLIKTKRESRMSLSQSADRKEQQLRQMRRDLKTAEASANAIKIDLGRLETKLDANLSRLSTEYQMTFEYAMTRAAEGTVENAREEVAQLRTDIERLGNINMNAPEEFDEVNTRYESMKKMIEELTLSRDKILSAIDEMDTIMKKQFKEMFDAINEQFNEIFRSLYGGGRAKLILQDPSDLLNTGIDIDAQPPGKAVQNNMLFSGGEKSLIALCVLFAILKVKPVPLVILDEVEAALDPGNVERFAQYLHNYTEDTQFIVVTHRVGTMEKADILFGVTMQHQGVSQMLKVALQDAVSMAEPEGKE